MAETPVCMRDDRKVIHLKLPQIGRRGWADWGPMRPDKRELPTSLYLPVATVKDNVLIFGPP